MVTLLALTAAPELASAQGFEFAAAGTARSVAAGAFHARADDPMALGYNPAALAFLPGYQLMLGSHLAFYDACVHRSGGYDDTNVSGTSVYDSRFGFPDVGDPSNFVNQPFPRVCRSGYPGPSPQLVFTGRPIPELGFGVGLLAPSGVGNAVWGNEDGTIDVNGTTLPTPHALRAGGPGSPPLPPHGRRGLQPDPRARHRRLVPVGHRDRRLHEPHERGLGHRRSRAGRANGAARRGLLRARRDRERARRADRRARHRRLRALLGRHRRGRVAHADHGLLRTDTTSFAPETTVLNDVRLQAGQPWQFSLSARYAERRERRYRNPDQAGRVTGRVEDHMQNEVWDIELDLLYQHNGQVRDFVVTPPAGAEVGVCEGPRRADGSCATLLQAPLPGALPIAHGWADQFSARLGADWNILPGQLAARLGTHFTTSGFNAQYQTQDVLPGMRLGLHAGMTFRIERFDISIAYAHIFQFSETIAAADANHRMVSATGNLGMCTDTDGASYDPNRPVPSRGCYPQGFGDPRQRRHLQRRVQRPLPAGELQLPVSPARAAA
ncbi:MAG: outer membrane protein transport protein [Sandaracinaceae bacterium]|nr:outer membrane protein transport protein [Sandaracinaceae bacterium]